jgi:hypothetical protein
MIKAEPKEGNGPPGTRARENHRDREPDNCRVRNSDKNVIVGRARDPVATARNVTATPL